MFDAADWASGLAASLYKSVIGSGGGHNMGLCLSFKNADTFDVIGLREQVKGGNFCQSIACCYQPRCISRKGGWIARHVSQLFGPQSHKCVEDLFIQPCSRRINNNHIRVDIQGWEHILCRSVIEFHVVELVQ